ncbi:MAG: carboxypeptidase regulatory-like domain-containing protein [Acidobacteria bacterium]|nr:carboxypeptidase regulatory-like domain-containing protein [Acidobacteriota bacterium]MBI3424276.1 carboxypeptidase regulatory-like domain-containing protein [Acidobacteriota bacterium]
MSQTKINLGNVRVASPCPKKWEEMAGDERVRFCSHCQLNVYNFSAMTKAEAESFLLKAEGRVCGRFYRRADGTMLTQDCPVGLRAVRQRVSRLAATAFSAVVGLFTGAGFAQQIQSETKADIQRSLRRYDQPSIQGTVYDQSRAVIAGARVMATQQQTKKVTHTNTNEAGRFRFVDLPAGEYEITVESQGFIKLSMTELKLTDDETITLDATMRVGEATMGAMLVLEPPLIPTNDTVLPTTLIRKDKPRQ